MTGFADSNMPLSKLTIANLHDSGYVGVFDYYYLPLLNTDPVQSHTTLQ